jgi:hypothetical protein
MSKRSKRTKRLRRQQQVPSEGIKIIFDPSAWGVGPCRAYVTGGRDRTRSGGRT